MIAKKWKTKAGLDAVIHKCESGFDTWYCGYVGVPTDHRYSGVDYCYVKQHNGNKIDAHRGLTFSSKIAGFDWCFGYDCHHMGDDITIYDLEYNIKQCESLARQLTEADTEKDTRVEVKINSFDDWYLQIAKLVAEKSKDESTKIGCAITRDNVIVTTGYNGAPRGVEERQERPLKYKYFEHAERNALYNALRIGSSVFGGTLYLSQWTPCTDCARGIIQSGIQRVVTTSTSIPERWYDDFKIAYDMMTEAGVDCPKPILLKDKE